MGFGLVVMQVLLKRCNNNTQRNKIVTQRRLTIIKFKIL